MTPKQKNQKQSFRDQVQRKLKNNRPGDRPSHTWASRVASVDLKLAYKTNTDQFISFIHSDCNANPEGISSVHDYHTESDLLGDVVESYLPERCGSRFIIWLSSNVWNNKEGKWRNETSWLTKDRQSIVRAIEKKSSVADIYRCSSSDSISIHDGTLNYTGPDVSNKVVVDGYINLSDTGERLLESLGGRVSLLSRGVNSPSGVWTPSLPSTSKVGLARSMYDLLSCFEDVRMPEFQRVDSIQDLNQFREDLGKPVVLKDPFGTWGTGVVNINLTDRAVEVIQAKQEEVRTTRGWNEFQLINAQSESFAFNSRGHSVPYGIAERALSGSINRKDDSFVIVSVPSTVHPLDTASPIDFVTLACVDSDGYFSAPSTMMRVSGKAGINGNSQYRYVNDISLDSAMQGSLKIPHPRDPNTEFIFNLREHLEDIAGRTVTVSEISSVLQDGAELGLSARNLSSFRAERNLAN